MPSTIDAWLEETHRSPRPYREFLRVPNLSVGLYVLPVGAEDGQRPHGQDEVYHVVRGRARFECGARGRPVGPGDVLFVRAREPHRFRSIEEELVLLVVFGPAEQEEASPP